MVGVLAEAPGLTDGAGIVQFRPVLRPGMLRSSMHHTSDVIEQHKLLTWVEAEIDAARIRTTVGQVLSLIDARPICARLIA